MARFKVTHSEDACCIDIRGDVRNAEPSTAVVRFPGGHIEVARHSDGSYWVHVARNTSINDAEGDVLGEIVDSRIDYTHEAYVEHGCQIPPMPAAAQIQHMAIRIARASHANAETPAVAPAAAITRGTRTLEATELRAAEADAENRLMRHLLVRPA